MSSLRGSAVRGGPLVATCGWTGTTPSRWRGTSHRRTPSMPPRASSSGSSTSSTTPPPASCRGPGGRGGVQGGGEGNRSGPKSHRAPNPSSRSGPSSSLQSHPTHAMRPACLRCPVPSCWRMEAAPTPSSSEGSAVLGAVIGALSLKHRFGQTSPVSVPVGPSAAAPRRAWGSPGRPPVGCPGASRTGPPRSTTSPSSMAPRPSTRYAPPPPGTQPLGGPFVPKTAVGKHQAFGLELRKGLGDEDYGACPWP